MLFIRFGRNVSRARLPNPSTDFPEVRRSNSGTNAGLRYLTGHRLTERGNSKVSQTFQDIIE
jgi:hypothetical protein